MKSGTRALSSQGLHSRSYGQRRNRTVASTSIASTSDGAAPSHANHFCRKLGACRRGDRMSAASSSRCSAGADLDGVNLLPIISFSKSALNAASASPSHRKTSSPPQANHLHRCSATSILPVPCLTPNVGCYQLEVVLIGVLLMLFYRRSALWPVVLGHYLTDIVEFGL